MPRLITPTPDTIPAEAQETLDKVGTQFGFVPNMFTTLASNPTVLDIVMTLQAKGNRLLDAKTRHTITLAVSQADGVRLLPRPSHGRITIGRHVDRGRRARPGGSSIDPARAAVARFMHR